VLPAPIVYLLGEDILPLGLLKPSLQEKDVARVVTFFGKDVSTTGPGRYHVLGNTVTRSSKGISEGELSRRRESRLRVRRGKSDAHRILQPLSSGEVGAMEWSNVIVWKACSVSKKLIRRDCKPYTIRRFLHQGNEPKVRPCMNWDTQ
jgi:hypothetical protein